MTADPEPYIREVRSIFLPASPARTKRVEEKGKRLIDFVDDQVNRAVRFYFYPKSNRWQFCRILRGKFGTSTEDAAKRVKEINKKIKRKTKP